MSSSTRALATKALAKAQFAIDIAKTVTIIPQRRKAMSKDQTTKNFALSAANFRRELARAEPILLEVLSCLPASKEYDELISHILAIYTGSDIQLPTQKSDFLPHKNIHQFEKAKKILEDLVYETQSQEFLIAISKICHMITVCKFSILDSIAEANQVPLQLVLPTRMSDLEFTQALIGETA